MQFKGKNNENWILFKLEEEKRIRETFILILRIA